jgi:hypothetical protein
MPFILRGPFSKFEISSGPFSLKNLIDERTKIIDKGE